MMRSNSGVGGKILLVFITFLLTIGLIVGGIFAVYKLVSVRKIASLFGADTLIDESYDGTIEDFIKLLSDTVSDGSVCLNDFAEISPLVGEKVNGVLDEVENTGLISVDRDALFATPLRQLADSAGSLVAVTATLNGLSETLGFTIPDIPLLVGGGSEPLDVYTRVNNNEEGAIDTEFTFGSASYSFYTRTKRYAAAYTDGSTELPVVQWDAKQLASARGVRENENGTLLYGEYMLYLCTEEAGAETKYTALTTANGAVCSYENGTARFALATGTGYSETVCVRTGENSYTPLSEHAPSDWKEEDTVYEPTVSAPYKYTPLYYRGTNGSYLPANTADPQTGAYLLDEERGGFALSLPYASKDAEGYYTQKTELYRVAVGYSAPMTEEEANALIAEAKQKGEEPPALYVRTDGVSALPATYAISALSSTLDTDAASLNELCDYLGIELSAEGSAEGVLNTLRYIPLSYIGGSMQAELQGIALGDVLLLDGNSPRLLLFFAYGDEGKDYEIGADGSLTVYHEKTVADLISSLNTLRIGDVISVTDESADILQAVKDWTLADFSDSGKIGSLTLGDVLDVGADAPAILQALKDVTLDGMSDAIGSLTLGDALGDGIESSSLLSLLRNSTLETLADDISSLALQTMFADSVYAYYEAGTVSQYNSLAAEYGAANLYVLENSSYLPYDETAGYDGSEPLYSPYRPVDADELENYKNVPLYTLQNGEMRLAAAVTGWSLSQQQYNEHSGDALYYDREGRDPVGSFTQSTVFTADTVYYWHPASESMQALKLSPTAYGRTGGSSAQYFTRLIRADAPETHGGTAYYKESNLYYYDIAVQSWQRVPLTGVYLNGSGSEVPVTEETDTSGLTLRYKFADGQSVPAGAALYTYGEVAGMWRYLLKDEYGFEQAYTLEDVNEMIANINHNINTATLRELVEDGIIILNVTPQDGETQEEAVQRVLNTSLSAVGREGTLGDCTTGELLELVAQFISNLPPSA